MIDLNGIEWNWWASIGWWLIPTAILGIMFFVTILVSDSAIGLAFIVIFFFGFAGWFLIGGTTAMYNLPKDHISDEQNRMATEQLEKMGFESIEMSGVESFTASKNGDYFLGTLFPLGENRYKVVEVPID